MVTKVTAKGQVVIPAAIRKRAGIGAGDQLEVSYVNSLVVLRKRTRLTPERVHSLSAAALSLPVLTTTDETTVAKAIRRLRARRRQAKPRTRN